MNAVMTVRWEIAEYWEACWANGAQPVKAMFGSDDAFAAFYTSKYLIQDTAEAVAAHLGRGFSKDPMAAYLEFWGVMQAIVIQPEAVCELYWSVLGEIPATQSAPSWGALKDLRNRCAGHPAKKTKKNAKGASMRSFMGRGRWTYERVMYEQYDSATGELTHPTFDLKALIQSYDAEAASVLGTVLAEMKRNARDRQRVGLRGAGLFFRVAATVHPFCRGRSPPHKGPSDTRTGLFLWPQDRHQRPRTAL
jgi:hypothetical protein